MENKKEMRKWLDDFKLDHPLVIAGPCSQVCPKGVDPAMGIQLLRGYLLGIRD